MNTSAWEGYGVYVVREPRLPFPKPMLSGPEDARALLQRCLGYQDREVFAIVLMDARNQVMGVNTVSVGSVSASIVHPREVFKPAILMAASSILLAHCHPSGDPTPSQDDIELTRRLSRAGQLLGIEVLDHIIVADASYCSFKERGIL